MENSFKFAKNILLKNGHLIDPFQTIDQTDVTIYIVNGLISDEKPINTIPSDQLLIIDCSKYYISPGFIDLHCHVYPKMTPLGVNPDEFCLRRGVTTVVDAGSTGIDDFHDFKINIIDRSITKIAPFLHVSREGLRNACCAGANGSKGECDDITQVDVEGCIDFVRKNQSINGLKIRLAEPCSNGGLNEFEAYRRSLKIRDATGLPLMVHHAISSIPTDLDAKMYADQKPDQAKLSCPGDLKKGDIYTHCFQGNRGHILDLSDVKYLDKTSQIKIPPVFQSVLEAKTRGVIFDLGHGAGSFSWKVAEACAAQNFWPDTISSDLHSDNIHGPVYDLPIVMTKILHLGMSLDNVIASVTKKPADILNIDEDGPDKNNPNNYCRSIEIGNAANITIFEIKEGAFPIEDSGGNIRTVKHLIRPKFVVLRDGILECDDIFQPTSAARLREMKESVDDLVQKYGKGFI